MTIDYYAYVAALTNNSLTILNVGFPDSPAFESHIAGAGAPNFLKSACDLYKEGDYCYVCCAGAAGGDACLTIIDVNDPATPTFKGTIPFSPGVNFRFVFVSGSYAYCTYQLPAALSIIDISNPAIPSITGSISYAALGLSATAGIGRAYKPAGNYAYIHSYSGTGLVDNDNALLVIDVSVPAAPTLAASIRGVANGIGGMFCFASGSYIYLGCNNLNALTIINISNPLVPTFKSSLVDAVNLNFVSLLYKEGNYCYCGCNTVFTIIDVSNPATPVFKSTITGFTTNPITVYKDGNLCYVADSLANKVYLIDVSNPALPTITGSISGSGAPNYLGMAFFIATGGYPPIPPVPPSVPLHAGSFLARREAWIGGL